MSVHCENGHPYSDIIHEKCPACRRGDPPVFGTTPHRLHRKDAPETSVVASRGVDSSKLERRVLGIIRAAGHNGIISDDVRAAMPDVPSYSSVTARYKALYEKGLIQYRGKRPGDSGRGQRVMRVIS
jgi:hypothetical protein